MLDHCQAANSPVGKCLAYHPYLLVDLLLSEVGTPALPDGVRISHRAPQLFLTDRANTLRLVICHSAVTLGLLGVSSEGTSEDT